MRNIYLSILFFCGVFSSTGQTKFGVTGGYILSTLIDGDGRTFDSEELSGRLYSQSSVYAGLYADDHIDEKLSVRYELNYIVAGGMLQAHIKDPGISFISRVEFHQLQIPVSLQYAPVRNLRIYSGPYLGAKTATRYKFTRYAVPASPLGLEKKIQKELSKQTNSKLSPFSLGILAGAGYNITRRVGLTARYNYTFTNMSSQKKESLRMHFLQAAISYNFTR